MHAAKAVDHLRNIRLRSEARVGALCGKAKLKPSQLIFGRESIATNKRRQRPPSELVVLLDIIDVFE